MAASSGRPALKPFTPWTEDTERAFLLALGMCGQAKAAAREIGRSPPSAYKRRKQNPDFAAAWDAAVARQQAAWIEERQAALGPGTDEDGGGRLVAGQERAGGWDRPKRAIFLRTLRRTKCVETACASAGMRPQAAYALKARSAPFARAWARALAFEMPSVLEVAWERAVNGREVPIVRGGEVVGSERRVSDMLLRELVRAEISAEVRRETEKLRKTRLDEEAERKRPAWQRRRPFEEVRASIQRKVEAIRRRGEEDAAAEQAADWVRHRQCWGALGRG